ncbi:MAG: ABC transporter permease [Gammaproteobacteria bacterium]
MHEYANPLAHRLKWAYLLGLVGCLLLPVFYTIYISFNYHGFGAARYEFTWQWYVQLFDNREIRATLGWSLLLVLAVTTITVPLGVLAAKQYKVTRFKVPYVLLMLSPLFVPADIMASALLVYFKNLNRFFAARFELEWFDLSFATAVVGQVLWCLPYVFVVVLVTMSRYRTHQTEAARTCGATAWQAFWQVEFPQIRAGVLSAAAFTVILSFNEYTRTNFLKGGFDTFPTYLVSYMLNTGMTPEVYAMAGLTSLASMLIVGAVLVYALSKAA